MALIALVGGMAPAALAQEAVQHGKAIARQWCAPCHALPGSSAAGDAAPPLGRTLHEKEITPGALRAWLSTPHPQMPDLSLTRAEIDSLIAYLRGLGE